MPPVNEERSLAVLVCQGCRREWEPQRDELAEVEQLVSDGCPECGDWLFVAELAPAGDPR